MFKLVPERTTWITVTWPGKAEDGTTVINSHRLKVLLVDHSDMTETLADETALIKDLIKRVARDWDGVLDEKDQPIPFSAGALAQLCEVPNYASARGFMTAYLNAWSAIDTEREKNSDASPADGRKAARPKKTATA